MKMELKVAAILFSFIAFSCISLSSSCDPAELEQMDLDSFLEHIDTNQNCSSAAVIVYERKYANKTVESKDFAPLSDSGNVYVSFEKTPIFLKHFGHLIERFHFNTNNGPFESSKYVEILRAINQHCSETLRELDMRCRSGKFQIFTEIRGPFKTIENLTITVNEETLLKTDNVVLNEMFPQVKKMDLIYEYATDDGFVDHVYPHLEEFHVGGWLLQNSTFFESVIKKNPQIKSVLSHYVYRSSLRSMSEHLPNLEKIYISELEGFQPTDTDYIHFKNVRLLVLDIWGRCKLIKNITFEGLNEVVITNGCECDVNDLALEHKNIQKLTLYNFMNDSVLHNITQNFSHLSEANFAFDQNVTAETVIHFVDNNKELNALKFRLSNRQPNEFKSEMESKIGHDFDITFEPADEDKSNFLVIRKIPVSSSATTVSV